MIKSEEEKMHHGFYVAYVYSQPWDDKESTYLKVLVHIKNNKTGEVRIADGVVFWDEDNNRPEPFWWSEGNGSCDCNRRLEWERVVKPDFDEEVSCGDELFSVNLENPLDRNVFYREFDDNDK